MHYEHTQEEIRFALTYISADERDVWVRMGMAIKDEFGEDGFALFDEWSKRGNGYKEADAVTTWKSCKVGGGITIATLIRMAMDNGYDPKTRPAPVPLSPERSAQLEAERAQRDEQARQAHEKKQAVAAQVALTEWGAASGAGESVYLRNKGVQGHGVRYAGDLLLVPVRDVDDKLWSLQRINAKGEKSFLKGGRVSGCFHLIGQIEGASRLLIAEGYATGATLHEATGDPVAVAFSDTNLSRVVEALRGKYPDLLMAVCADDDRPTETKTGKNPGIVGARNAARRGRAQAVIQPDLSGLPDGATDFNDLAVRKGLKEVRRQIDERWSKREGAETGQNGPRTKKSESDVGEIGKRKKNDSRAAEKPSKDRRPRFRVDDTGVWYLAFSDDGDSLPPYLVCSPLWVVAESRTGTGDDWGYAVEMVDSDGTRKGWVVPFWMLVGDGNEYCTRLARMGLKIAPGSRAKSLLTVYLKTSNVTARATITDRIGWHGEVFVLPDRSIGEAEGERVLFQSDGSVASQFKQSGTLDQWKERVASLCVDNSRLMFCVSMAFAAPLLRLSGLHSGGFHLVGDSSCGKTTGLCVAASVFGGRDYIRSWRTTDNAMELLAAQHSDAPLILDELAQVDPKVLGDTVYMLANESGKGRATRTATAKTVLTWCTLFLSTGEVDLPEHMAEAGKAAKAGQEIRLVGIPADAGKRMGMFEELHGRASGSEFSDDLQKATKSHYGTAGMRFLEHVVSHHEALVEDLPDSVAALVAKWGIGGDAHGQVRRVAARFALVALAGEMATKEGLTGWPVSAATEAAEVCLTAWIDSRGGVGNSQDRAAIRQVRKFISLHGSSRFMRWKRINDDHAPAVQNQAGFVRALSDDETAGYAEAKDALPSCSDDDKQRGWYVFPDVFREEVCKGHSVKAVEKLLIERGVLQVQSDGRPAKQCRVPCLPKEIRLYHITPKIFEIDL